MIKYQDLLGKTAYSLEEGRQWGKVHELFVDKKTFMITGMVIRGEEDRFLPLIAAKKIDESVVFKSASDFTTVASAESGIIRGSRITGLKVMTEHGNEEGTTVSFYFKKDSGEITHYEISKSVIKENVLMQQDGLVNMGDDAMIITEEAAEVAAEMKSKDNLRKTIAELGRNAGAFAAAAGAKLKGYKAGAERGIENLKKGVKAATDKYGPGVKDFAEKTKQGAKNAGAKAKEAADKYGPKIKEGAQKAGAKAKEAAEKYGPKIKEAGTKAKDAIKGAWNKMTGKNKKDI